jgi:hypothetical protein
MKDEKPAVVTSRHKVNIDAVVTVPPWEGTRVMGTLSATVHAQLPISLATNKVGMVYKTNEHLLKERDGQIYAAGHVYDSISTIIADPDYYGVRKVAGDRESLEFELWKHIATLNRWVKGCFKAIRSAQSASGQDEIWVSTGWSLPDDKRLKRALRSGRAHPVAEPAPHNSPHP